QAVEALENEIGRQLAIVRVYKRWTDPFPTPYDRWLRNSGHTLLLSVSPVWPNGSHIRWANIALAAPGSAIYDRIVSWADRIKAFGALIYFVFDHEPETANPKYVGTPSDFVDAWRKVVEIFRERGANNARFVLTLTAHTFARTDGRSASAWYPGDAYVDAIGADGYNFFGCRPNTGQSWRSFAQIFEPVREFGLSHASKPLMIPEWGSVEDPATPGRKAQWISDARSTLESPDWSQFKAVLYYHSQSSTPPRCDFWADTSSSALGAFAAMGADPYFSGVGPAVIDSVTPTRGVAGTHVAITGANFVAVQSVAFGSVSASFLVVDRNHIEATVPQGAV